MYEKANIWGLIGLSTIFEDIIIHTKVFISSSMISATCFQLRARFMRFIQSMRPIFQNYFNNSPHFCQKYCAKNCENFKTQIKIIHSKLAYSTSIFTIGIRTAEVFRSSPGTGRRGLIFSNLLIQACFLSLDIIEWKSKEIEEKLLTLKLQNVFICKYAI